MESANPHVFSISSCFLKLNICNFNHHAGAFAVLAAPGCRSSPLGINLREVFAELLRWVWSNWLLQAFTMKAS